MWNTHHSILSKVESFGTWTKYGMEIVRYFKMHREELFVIWRPHPLFFGALEKYMGKDEADLFWEEVRQTENFFLDDEETYLSAFSVSDILISDASSMVKEFLYMDKPVIVLRSSEAIVENIKPQECLYVCDNIIDISKILGDLLSGKHIKEKAQKDYISAISTEANVGETILECILNKYDSEE